MRNRLLSVMYDQGRGRELMKSILSDIHTRVVDRFFKPSNAQMLASAADQGLDLSKPITFTFYLAFRHANDADKVAARLETMGYKITRETDQEDSYPFEVEAEVEIPGTENEIEQQEVVFRNFTREYPARYDDYSISFTDEDSEFF